MKTLIYFIFKTTFKKCDPYVAVVSQTFKTNARRHRDKVQAFVDRNRDALCSS